MPDVAELSDTHALVIFSIEFCAIRVARGQPFNSILCGSPRIHPATVNELFKSLPENMLRRLITFSHSNPHAQLVIS
jgi:hypothetical protein